MHLRGNVIYNTWENFWKKAYKSSYFRAQYDETSERTDWSLSERQLFTQSNGRTLLGQDTMGRLHFLCTPHDKIYAVPSGGTDLGGQFKGYIGQYYQNDTALLLGKMKYDLELDNGLMISGANKQSWTTYYDDFLPVTATEHPELETRIFSFAPILEKEAVPASSIHPVPGPAGAFYCIEVKNISKRYRNTVLDDISFTAEKGQCVGIIGANGCGKTTLLSIMAGVNKAQSGKIYYNNELADKKSVFKKYIAYVPQENPLIDELTTKDNLLLWLGSNKKIKDGFENGVLKDLGIDEFLNKQVNELSGGMKRRLSIGISLSNNAPIMLLDEPGSALDIYGKQEVNSYILNYVKNGGTVVMSTHDRDEIDLCTKLYKIEDGILKECEG